MRKLCVLIGKKPSKLDKKTRKKTKNLINKRLPKLDEKEERKIDYLYCICCFVGDEKPPKPS